MATQLAHEEDADGYAKLGVTTADECYAKAAEYAQKAMALDGYAPLSSDEWHNEKTGFNLATGALDVVCFYAGQGYVDLLLVFMVVLDGFRGS